MYGEHLNKNAAVSQVDKDLSKNLSYMRSATVYKNMRDPALLKYYYRFRTVSLLQRNELEGSSPPDIFVGRFGYPNVFIGPMIPPQFGDTSILSTPEEWVGKSIPEIVEYRSMLVRGMYKTRVTNVEGGKIENAVKELALSDKFIYADAMLSHRPDFRVAFSENSQPYGPSAPLKELRLGSGSTNVHVEDAYSDTDMNASTAILELYNKGERVSKIQKALSAGILGIGGNRKFVPTRWSITAVDDTIGKDNLKEVRSNSSIDSIRVYYNVALDNRWIILMVPGAWSYELVEAWYPKTIWNLEGESVSIFSSYEFFGGRSKYAEIGGCYYAARLAVSDLLRKERKQATVIILREAHAGYIMPMGVWNVREHVRQSLRGEPLRFSTLDEAVGFIGSKMEIPIRVWMKNSTILRYVHSQKKLPGFQN